MQESHRLIYQDTVSMPEHHHFYQTWQSLRQAQRLKTPAKKFIDNQKLETGEHLQLYIQISNLTVYKISKVTAYCMFSMDARRTLLSGSSFFPSRPKLNCSNKNHFIK